MKTSGPSTAVQEPPGVSIARASVAENEIAGRPSQSTSIRSDISEPPTKDIADPASDIKGGQEVRYNQEEEIYVDLDGQGNLTLMKVKDVLDPIEKEDDFIKQLEICKL